MQGFNPTASRMPERMPRREVGEPRQTPVSPIGIGNPIQVGPMTPGVPVFHKGTDFVEKTGPAILERGEKVIPKEQNMSMDSIKDILGSKEAISKSPKKIKRMVHTKSHNGKHLVTHEHHHPHAGSEHDETHALNDMAELHQHMEDHAGTPNDGEQAEANPAPQLTPSGPMSQPQPGM